MTMAGCNIYVCIYTYAYIYAYVYLCVYVYVHSLFLQEIASCYWFPRMIMIRGSSYVDSRDRILNEVRIRVTHARHVHYLIKRSFWSSFPGGYNRIGLVSGKMIW